MNLVAGTALSLAMANPAFAAGTTSVASAAEPLLLAQSDSGCSEGEAPLGADGACVAVDADGNPIEEAAPVEEEAAPVEPEAPPAVEETVEETPPAEETVEEEVAPDEPVTEPALEEPVTVEPAEAPAAEEPVAEEPAQPEEPAEAQETQVEDQTTDTAPSTEDEATPEEPVVDQSEPAPEEIEDATPAAETTEEMAPTTEVEEEQAAPAAIGEQPAAETEATTETDATTETPTDLEQNVDAEADTTTEERSAEETTAEQESIQSDTTDTTEVQEEPVTDTSENVETVEQPVAPMDGEEAALTDSGKEAGVSAEGEAEAAAEAEEAPAGQSETVVVTEESAPRSDEEAQAAALPTEIESVEAEQGQEITGDAAARAVVRRPQEREGSRVVGRYGNREIVQLATGALVVATVAALAANASNNANRDDRRDEYVPRYRRGAERVYVEELRGGRYRETVERRNGVRVVTVYNEYGEVLRRTRISPDGNERTLVYVPRDRWDSLRDPNYDPGDELPPLVIRIPRDEYIFDVEEPVSEERYYDFLAQPPVERVERLYSVDEVRRSARIRDKVRRVDLGTVNFEFGRAGIEDSEIDELQSLAEAMERLLDRNPAEVFLIEGHTDAVGSDAANLALSDARAESVASALTNVFGIPPENLETQGYGERYLKIRTEDPARENRRVAVRRITPLVSPERIASSR
ncbi:flagellar motor protein MotB [Notoacmeibacter ruber]|uniref:Flagellar motor protein MotB n=2 Tax=Notoacmeibacter ruber TaxID=2670375 RepID=A0A3L7JC29_9HYPH|nr:flagellar motor protein MotB [Notoacmeibacter ruber]